MWRKIGILGILGGLVAGGSAAGQVHTVGRGETLEAIGRRYGVGVPALAAANGLRNPDLVPAGMALTIPSPAEPLRPSPSRRIHTVGRGETLEAIARRYGVDVGVVATANGLPDPNRIVAGTSLSIPSPGGGPARPTTALLGPGPASATTRQETVVLMPPAQLAAARTAPRIVVPPDRAALRNAFIRFSRLAGVPSDLAMALAWQESGWQRHRVSSTNAVGVMQLMPDTVEFVSVVLLGAPAPLDPRDPIANIRMGTRFLRYLLDANGGNVDLALASYYQGLRSVKTYGLLDETRRFVANVKALRGRV